jgi:hypothetical protein
VISLRVARSLRFTAAGSKAAPTPGLAELSASLLALLDSSMEDVLFETSGALGRESTAFVATCGPGSVCACARTPVEANNATTMKIRFLLRSFIEVRRTRAIIKNHSLTG